MSRDDRRVSDNDSMAIWNEFLCRTGLTDPDLRSTVLALSQIPYGRPTTPTPAGVLQDWRGTCSTKHLLLREFLGEHWPVTGVQLWHRVYRLMPQLARAQWGPDVASVVPLDGLVDVHNYATVRWDGDPLVLDVTFPLADWDGTSPMEVACGPGEDRLAGHDLLDEKRQLVAAYCDPVKRERFIAALSATTRPVEPRSSTVHNVPVPSELGQCRE
jgi:hypothetical protein